LVKFSSKRRVLIKHSRKFFSKRRTSYSKVLILIFVMILFQKKLSIPYTVSRVLVYIPKLQQQVERLIQRKEELLSKLSRQADDLTHQENQRKGTMYSSLSSVSASRLSDREVVIHISTNKLHRSSLSEILVNLEEAGLLLLNSSSFESFGGRVFYNLHLQVS